MSAHVPFNVPSLEGRELELVAQAMRSGHTSSSGTFSRQAREILLRGDRRRRGAADDLVHVRPGAQRDAAGPAAG